MPCLWSHRPIVMEQTQDQNKFQAWPTRPTIGHHVSNTIYNGCIFSRILSVLSGDLTTISSRLVWSKHVAVVLRVSFLRFSLDLPWFFYLQRYWDREWTMIYPDKNISWSSLSLTRWTTSDINHINWPSLAHYEANCKYLCVSVKLCICAMVSVHCSSLCVCVWASVFWTKCIRVRGSSTSGLWTCACQYLRLVCVCV